MRCPICGSKIIYEAIDHKHFSGGKAVAGAVLFGVVGAAAGFVGKDKKGYKCGACGAFSENTMDMNTEFAVNKAVRTAEDDGDFASYNLYKKTYPYIEAVNFNQARNNHSTKVEAALENDDSNSIPKNIYKNTKHDVKCPVFVEEVIIKTVNGSDSLSLLAWNHSDKNLRSVYFDVKVLDDVGDLINEIHCVYQGLSVSPGNMLPLETEFKLNTDIAYKIDFRCTKAAFNDDTVWRDNGEDYKEIAIPTLLQPEDFPKYKAFKQKFCEKTSLTEDIDVYQPVFAEEYVQCVCGFPFEIGSKCAHCGLNVEDIANIISFENLVEFEKENIIKIAESRFNAVKGIFEKSKVDALEHAKSLLPADDNDDYEYAIICYEEALETLAKVSGWKAADELAKTCNDKIKEIKEAQEAERLEAERRTEIERQEKEKRKKEAEERAKRNRKLAIIILLPIIAIIIVLLLLFNVIIPSIKYNSAISYMEDGEYTQAIYLFEELGDYSDSQAKIVECNSAITEKEYQKGLSLLNSQNFNEALKVFENLGDYKDSHTQILETKYQNGLFYYNKKDFENSNLIFNEILNYKDSKSKIHYHEYAKSVTTQPTCDKEGTTTLSCKNCSHTYAEPIVAKGHTYKETVVLKPTCTTTGTKNLTCSECNYTITETIKATGHSYTSKVTKPATCESTGTKTLTCKCGDSRTESIKATGHSYSKATCTSPSTCSKCKTTNGSALGHTTSTSVCSRCKYNFMKPITITDESSFRDYGTEWKKYPIPGGTYKITISLKEYNYFESEKFHTFALRKNDILGDVIYLNNSLKGELVETKYITSSEDFVLFTEGNAFSVKIIVEPVN